MLSLTTLESSSVQRVTIFLEDRNVCWLVIMDEL